MHRARTLFLLASLVLLPGCGGSDGDADRAGAGDTLAAPAVAPGDTLAVPPAMTSDSGSGAAAAAPPAAGSSGGTRAATGGATKAAPAAGGAGARGSGGTAAGAGARTTGMQPTDIAVAAGAAAGAGGLQVMPWENLVPLVIADLRALVSRQERYFAANERYSSDAGPLGASARDGWTVRIAHAGPRGWSAVATQAFYPGRSCVIWVGASIEAAGAPKTATAGLRGKEGEPVCDPAAAR